MKFTYSKRCAFIFTICLLGITNSVAQEDDDSPNFVNLQNHLLDRLQPLYDISPHTSDLMGENHDLTSGTVSFSRIDGSVPGNSAIEVAYRTKYETERPDIIGWYEDIPRIENDSLRSVNTSAAWSSGQYCSGNNDMYTVRYNSYDDFLDRDVYGYIGSKLFLPGMRLIVPGKANDKILENNDTVASSTDYKYVTPSKWRLSCYTAPNSTIDGFKATSPDGISYYFTVYSQPSTNQITNEIYIGVSRFTKERELLMVSKIEDKFGNSANYTYDNFGRLLTITANDGRSLSVSTVANGKKLTVNGREWTYITDPTTGQYTVTEPDDQTWQYNLFTCKGNDDGNDGCGEGIDNNNTMTVKHPDGTTGKFEFAMREHNQMNVHRFSGLTELAQDSTLINNYSLVRKSLSGSGLTANFVWNYEYSQTQGGYYYSTPTPFSILPGSLVGTLPPNIEATEYNSVTITNPDDSAIKHYINRNVRSFSQGSVEATEIFEPDDTLVRQTQDFYNKGQRYGTPFTGQLANPDRGRQIPVLAKRLVIDNNDIYTSMYSDFDVYDVPSTLSEENSYSQNKRITKTSFVHDVTNWQLNLATTKELGTAIGALTTVSEVKYSNFANTSGQLLPTVDLGVKMPVSVWKFGSKVVDIKSYHLDGNLKRIEQMQGLRIASGALQTANRYQLLTNYKRGLPQTVTVPKRYASSGTLSISRTVDNNGWVTSTSDLNGVVNTYGYDEKGRIAYVDPADTAVADTLYSWSYDGGASSNQPKREVTRCTLNTAKNGCEAESEWITSTTTYDTMLRGLLVATKDEKTDITVYQNFGYDAFNKQTFASYSSSSASELGGHTYKYDALQRAVEETITGGGTRLIAYIAGNKIRETEARTDKINITTTEYLAYGNPDYSQSLIIDSPESTSTTMTVNVFGDITSIKQKGKNKADTGFIELTETRVYDTLHNLCKTVRNDVGTSVYNTNVLGEVQWKAQGVTGGANTNCASNVTVTGHSDISKKINILYDNLGAAWKVTYNNSLTPDVINVLDNQGNLMSLTAGTVSHSYSYNSLHLLEDETLAIPGKSPLMVDYDYNAQGHLSFLTYPDGDKVDYAPNGLGQPTKAQRLKRTTTDVAYDYATAATYYPTGSINTFSYGNGLTHKTTLNSRNIPSGIKDSKPGTTALHYGYTYDNNLNVNSITDHTNSSFNLSNMLYDGLNRLTATTGGTGIDSSTITYDGLGNITTYNSKGRNLDYNYNTTSNRLTSVTGFSGKYSSFGYDDRGNIVGNGSGTAFTFNRANQMTAAGNGSSYLYDGHNRRVKRTNANNQTTYSLYSHSGSLLYRENDEGGINYVYLGTKLIAKEGNIPVNAGKQHYRPFGSSIEGEIDDAGYTGHKFDTDIGLSYMQARYYDPVIGRFYSNDPLGFRDIHSFNRYAYANNNPYKYTDPDGRENIPLARQNDQAVKDLANGTITMEEFNPPEQFPSSGTEATIVEFNLSGGGSLSVEAGIVKDSAGNKGIQLSVQYGGGTPEVSLEAGKELTNAGNISELNGASGTQTIGGGEGVVGSASIIFAPTYTGGSITGGFGGGLPASTSGGVEHTLIIPLPSKGK